ncbi:MAG: DUF3798 domain-containing protein [bacterium]|nr:DUF3798 domain-containing protein [bacterium]
MRMTKILVCALVLVLAVSLVGSGCKKVVQEGPLVFKIGLMTGTVSQGEDEYRAAERLVEQYPGRIVHLTYPDNFMQEQETTITQIVSLAADPDIKAIVICQGVPGTAAAIDTVRADRPDMIFIIGVAHEDPNTIIPRADIVMEVDNPSRGKTIPELAHAMGAKKFLHYSFPRHMSMVLLAQRRDLMIETCAQLGVEFIFVTAPDPMGPDGIPGTQQFIVEDIPRQVAVHGKDIAIFGTNCGMMEPMIKQVLATGAIFVEQCCPSPTHGYPAAMGIEGVKGDGALAGNMPAILEAIRTKVVAAGAGGRFATWPAPINMVFIQAGVQLAMDIVEGKADPANLDQVKAAIDNAPLMAGAGEAQVKRIQPGANYYLVVLGSYIFK